MIPGVLQRIALAAALLSIAACSRSPETNTTAAAPPAPTLLRGAGPEPDSLDPQKARSVESQGILRDLCEGLTTLDKTAGVAPGVATDWTVSADGKKYTFNLRPDARWSNGERVVAADFVAALRRLADPATASAYAQVIDVIENASDIVARKKPPESLGVQAPAEGGEHGSVLAERVLEPDDLRGVVVDHRSAGLEPVDVAVMDLADKVADDATRVTAADVDRLRSLGLSDEEILDVVLAAAARCFFSKVLDGVGAEPDAKYRALDPELRDALTVGRPIAGP